ncbi:phosphate ABC transporter substrate-binding protein PstS [Cellulomonas massiliensis]|uniref:phosphate ABC transporter substrate-binding protein PstS n=1 Tax=Cellulomonas massiliensis TaxID=1465811 RepID=UPI0002E0E1CB|nr:phosphate ABC transporter substrate-binding protein PstS [Cellulomonas massiliensis]
MKRTHATVGATLAGLLALTLAACGSDDPTGTGSTPASGSSQTSSSLSGTLNGGGSSAQEKAQQAWVAGFQTANPDTTVNYSTTDSGAGRKGLLDGSLDFAGTDSALTEEELASATERCYGGAAIDLPVYISPIAVAFNIEGVTELNLSADVVAKIFAGTITTWDDPAITEANPDATLSGAITVVHRSDDSGTSKNFQDYLSKAAPDVWSYEVSNTWPVSVGQGANGTSGVVQTIQSAPGTIGYADASAVGSLGKVSLGVGDDFVAPTADAAAKTVDVSPRDDSRAEGDIVIEVDRTTTEAGAYPAILVSYLAVCDTYDTQEKADLVKAYATYAAGDGQEQAATAAGSAPISDTLRTDVLAAIDAISTQ